MKEETNQKKEETHQTKGLYFLIGLVAILFMGANGKSVAKSQTDIPETFPVVAPFQFESLGAAQAAGYIAYDLNKCISNADFGGVGYRYVNNSLIDSEVNYYEPEALLYVPGPHGTLRLGGMEYIVRVNEWNATHTGWPQINGHQFELNPGMDAYVLHIWAWENNPSGKFEYWNPQVSCSQNTVSG